MKFNRVFLIQAEYDKTFSNVLPYGLGTLSEVLAREGIENEVFDLNLDNNFERLKEKMLLFKPDLVGYSLMSLNYQKSFDTMKDIKKILPEVKIVAGGPHISTVREAALKAEGAIDYGSVLEGEDTLLELCQGKEPQDIKGLLYRFDKGEVMYSGDRAFIEDLDRVPFPKYGKFEKSAYSRLITIITTRGCPYSCIYCPVNLAIGKKLRFRSPEKVVNEIEYHYRLGYREFSFRDDNFSFNAKHVYDICDEIEKRNLKGLYLMCDNGVRADKVDEKLLRRMKEAGFRMLGFGIESGSPKVLKTIKKGESLEDMEKGVRIACDLGYIVELFFLIGSPGESRQDFEESVKFALKFPVMIASFYHILPYPGTELFEIAKNNNYLIRGPEEYLNDGSQRRNTPFMATPEFSYELRKKAFSYAYKATAKHIARTRMLYSRKNAYEKFKNAGFPELPAEFFAGLYAARPVQKFFSKNRFVSNIKERFKGNE